LAKEMIRLAGADDDDIKIQFTGLRPGEKLHAKLFTHEEELSSTNFENIMMATHECAEDEDGRVMIEELIAAAERRDWWEMDRCLVSLVPDYSQVGLAAPPTELRPRAVGRSRQPDRLIDLSDATDEGAVAATGSQDAAG